MRKRSGIVWLIALVMVLVLTACTSNKTTSPSPGNSPGSSDPTGEPTVDYANMKAEVTFTTIFSDDEFNENIGNYVRAKFPNYTINHFSQRNHSLEELLTAGTPFDIYFGRANSIINTYAPVGLAYDMKDLVAKHGIDLEAFEPGFVESGMFDGKLYALPIFNDSLVLFYNRDLFDRFGVEYPRDGMTWDEVFELAKKLDRVENGVQYMGLWMSPKHYFRMNSLSQGFIDPETNKVTVDNENWKRIFELFAKMSENPGVRNAAKENFPSHDHFRGGSPVVGMYVFLTEWIAVSQTQMPSLNWDMVSMPTFSDLPGVGTQPYANYAGITSTSKNKDAAAQVLKYLVSEEYQMEVSKKGKLTPLKSQNVKDVAFANHPEQDKNFGAVYVNANAPLRQMHQLEDKVVDILNEKVTLLVKGEKDINTLLREAQEEAQAIIDSELAK